MEGTKGRLQSSSLCVASIPTIYRMFGLGVMLDILARREQAFPWELVGIGEIILRRYRSDAREMSKIVRVRGTNKGKLCKLPWTRQPSMELIPRQKKTKPGTFRRHFHERASASPALPSFQETEGV